MSFLIWFGCGLVGVVMWISSSTLIYDDSEEYTNEILNGGAIILYILAVLAGFIGAIITIFLSVIAIVFWFTDDFEPPRNLGKFIYGIFRRKDDR